MATMRASLAVGALVLVTWSWAAPACAHSVERVRRELTEQGFEQLEFQRTKAPFKLDACRDGKRYHLHVDWYGKLTEQTLLGPCDGDAASEPASEPSVAAPSPPSDAAPVSSGAKATSKRPPAQELCSRYFPGVGKTLQVPCE